MNAGEVRDLFAYNRWANEQMLENLSSLPESEYLLDRKSSHGGIHGTFVHIVSAHYIWLLRWRQESTTPAVEASKATKTLADAAEYWRRTDAATESFFEARLSDGFPGSTFVMKTLDGKEYVHEYGGTMRHLINHSSYHRGQIVTMIRQAGRTPVSTDLIKYIRERR